MSPEVVSHVRQFVATTVRERILRYDLIEDALYEFVAKKIPQSTEGTHKTGSGAGGHHTCGSSQAGSKGFGPGDDSK